MVESLTVERQFFGGDKTALNSDYDSSCINLYMCVNIHRTLHQIINFPHNNLKAALIM